MVSEPTVSGWGGRVAVGILRGDPPQVFVAEDHTVLGRVLALEFVARERPERFGSPDAVERARAALLEERWADALFEWMNATDEVIDAYPDEELWTSRRLDADRVSFEIRLARIFDDPDATGEDEE